MLGVQHAIWRGVTVLVRADLNVPLGEDQVVSDFEAWRIHKAWRSVRFLQEKGARVVVVSHLGRDPLQTMAPVHRYISEKVQLGVRYVPDLIGEKRKKALSEMDDGDVVLLENVRSLAGEKENNPQFARALVEGIDVCVFDAFAVAHRKHASVVGVPEIIPTYAGLLVMDELDSLRRVRNPKQPLFAVIGGLKFDTKLPVIEKLLPNAHTILVAGALAHAIYRARGYAIGTSVVDESADVSALANHPKIVVPKQVVVMRQGVRTEVSVEDGVRDDEAIIDLAPSTFDGLRENLLQAETILWNGPLGFYEEGHDMGTLHFMELLEQATAYKVAGGGDTVAVIQKHAKGDTFDFISTGGGAMLEFLAQGELPGIEALG